MRGIVRSEPARWAVTLALPAAAVAVRAALQPALGDGNPLTLLYPAVLAVAVLCGLVPALVATGIAVVGAAWFLIPPFASFQKSPGDLLALALFAMVAVALSVMTVWLREALSQARASTERAEALLRVREGFGSMLAHEIRTPVTVILGNAKLLLRDGLDRETIKSIAVDVDAEAEHLRRLIEDLLVLNRGDDRLDPVLEPVVLGPLLAGIVAHEQATGGPVIELHVVTGLPIVLGEPLLIEQVTRNLLSNARKYGGTRPIEVTVRPGQRTVRMIVADHGSGIPAGERTRIFDAFWRADQAKGSGQDGAGVGLFVCRRLVEAMGGTIAVQDTPGGGASFVVDLPVFVEEAPVRQGVGAGVPSGREAISD